MELPPSALCELRAILIKEISHDLAQGLSDKEIQDFGVFLLTITSIALKRRVYEKMMQEHEAVEQKTKSAYNVLSSAG